jgi:hypothetical protein
VKSAAFEERRLPAGRTAAFQTAGRMPAVRPPGWRRSVLLSLLLFTLPILAAPVPPLPFDRILRHDELTALLRSWSSARPQLMRLESIGKTPEGRDLWFVTVTNGATGPAADKPALLVDGNMHATEWAGGVAALHFLQKLLDGYGTDARITRLLDTRAVYILPRMTPDGVDATLAQGRFIRSVDRPWPPGPADPGIYARDVDGDGRSLFMRYRDPNGAWKPYPGDARLLVPRPPDDAGGGEAWRVLPEGLIEGYDGVTIADPPAREPIDLGSNFPGDEGTAPRGRTAGAYPGSEPEVAAYIAAINARPNIVAHVTCHTFGGLILTPPVNLGEKLPGADARIFQTLAGKGAELTGYDAMSYLDLRSEDRESHIPSAFGWLYDRLGIYSFITEIWNPLKAAGISLEGTTASAWLWGYHPIEDELKLLRFSERELGGDGFVPWRPFQHPQLGPVEIGGFDLIRYWYNVPFSRLQKEVAPHSEWLVWLGLTTPQLAMRALTAEPAGEGLWRVRAVVENQGWLPTNGSQKAVEQGATGGVLTTITLPSGARLVDGAPSRDLGQLQGRSAQRSIATWWGYTAGTPDRGVAEWIVAAPAGTTLTAETRHPRAGRAHAQVVLGR